MGALHYHKACERMLKHLGKTTAVEEIRPDDLMQLRRAMAETMGPHTLAAEVARSRVILRYAFENCLTNKPLRFGDFKPPPKHVLRRAKAKAGPKLFKASTVRKLLEGANTQMKAMILLGCNCAFGNADCGQLTEAALDLDAGWIDFPRPKTGIPRRCPLWPETVAALKAALAVRKSNTDALVFRTQRGNPWFVDSHGCSVACEFRRLCKDLGVYEHRKGFYTCRHVFQTVADECGDYLATKRIMGHEDGSMGNTYREAFQDSRLIVVSDHVRAWLFGGVK
jgi:integrase